MLTGAYVAFSLSPVGPAQWRNTPSLRWLNTLIPTSLLCVLFLTYVVLNVWGNVRASVIGAWLGLFLYFLALIALIVTTRPGRPSNPIALAAVILACVLHFAAARLATFQDARK